MIQVMDFIGAFWIRIEEEPLNRKGWFDTVERRYLSEDELRLIYGEDVTDDKRLIEELYIPIPVLHERDVIVNFLKSLSMDALINRYKGFYRREDLSDLLNYKDENGTWLHEAYFAYVRQRRKEIVNNWIHDNRIDNAVAWFPVSLNSEIGLNTGSSFLERLRRSRKLCAEDEEIYLEEQTIRRAKDNSLVYLEPIYKRISPK